jgi:hypothetical protein
MLVVAIVGVAAWGWMLGHPLSLGVLAVILGVGCCVAIEGPWASCCHQLNEKKEEKRRK